MCNVLYSISYAANDYSGSIAVDLDVRSEAERTFLNHAIDSRNINEVDFAVAYPQFVGRSFIGRQRRLFDNVSCYCATVLRGERLNHIAGYRQDRNIRC